MIRQILSSDAKEIAEIYNYYILNTVVTFETESINEEIVKERILLNNPKLPWLVYEIDNKIIGYAYASDWKPRSGYKQSVESTIYLKPDENQKGNGTMLYKALLNQLKEQGFHAIIGGIALPNEASIRLHEKLGFIKVAHFKETGFKFNKWIDVGYWELLVHP